jgi:hypothetical protein
MKESGSARPDVKARAESRPRLDNVDALVPAQQSLVQGEDSVRAEITFVCFALDASGACALPVSFVFDVLSLAGSFLYVSQCSDSAGASAGGIACDCFAAPCAWPMSLAPQSFSSLVFFGFLNRAPLQAPVEQPPSTPAQQGIEQECEADRAAKGIAPDNSASVKSAAEKARKKGRAWIGTALKGEASASSVSR